MDLNTALGLIRPIADFPQPGILFQDISPLLSNGEAFSVVVDTLSQIDARASVIAGIEARGFILASAMASHRGHGFVPIRKKGKLPHSTYSRSYGLEYGSDELEIQTDAFSPSQQVLLVDDVLATGGTIEAALELISAAGGVCGQVAVLCEIDTLGGRSRLLAKYPNLIISALVHQ